MKVLGFAPATMLGVTLPLDAQKDLVITPLERVAVLNKDVAAALDGVESQLRGQAEGVDQGVQRRAGQGGGIQRRGQGCRRGLRPCSRHDVRHARPGPGGLLEGALTSNERLPYTLDNTKAMLFFQEGPDSDVADSLDMQGTQWGITHEVGNLPGPWWLWPYAIWYQIPPLTDGAERGRDRRIAHGAVLPPAVLRAVHSRPQASAEVDSDLPDHLAGLVREEGKEIANAKPPP